MPPVRVLLFATARTAVGRARIDRPVPPEGLPAHELLEDLTRAHPSLRRVLTASRILRNGEPLRRPSERVVPGDELAVHPPYGGG